MIVCNTLKDLTNATNTNDAAGAVAVKEYVAANGSSLTPSSVVTVDEETTTLESYIADVASENMELTTTTPVDVSGTEKTLQAYVEDVAEDQAQIYTDGVLDVVDITDDITITAGSTGTFTISKAVKTGHYVEIYGILTATEDISAGSNIAVATLSGIPTPVSSTDQILLGTSIALLGTSLIGTVMFKDGSITARYYIGDGYLTGYSSTFKIGYITTD